MTEHVSLTNDGPSARWSEDACLLREFTHRTANEVGAALASLHLLKSRGRLSGHLDLLEQCIARLEHFGAVNRLLAGSFRGPVDLAIVLENLCRGITGARPAAAGSIVTLTLPTIEIDGAIARRVALVTAELVTNALRHSLEGRKGRLEIRGYRDDGELVLEVADDGPGVRVGAATSGSGLGRGIVAELVERGGGSVSVKSSRRGTTVQVIMPLVVDRAPDVTFPF